MLGPGVKLGRMIFPKLFLLSLGLALPVFAASPNVVVFLADDAGWGDYSQSGNTQVATPNIDSIAKGGVSMDRFYVCPVSARRLVPNSSLGAIIHAAVCVVFQRARSVWI